MSTHFPYYHVSETSLGRTADLYPRVPKRLAPGEDATTPRICVAPSIANCLRMVAWTDYQDEFYVYGLLSNPVSVGLQAPEAGAVPDLGRTARHVELWVTRKARFIQLGVVRMSRVDLVTGRPCYYWVNPYIHDPILDNDPERMTDERVQAFLLSESYHQQVAAEMEAELRAEGGVMVGDALQKYIDALPPNGVLVLADPNPDLTRLHQAMVHDMGSKEVVILVPPEELAKGITYESVGPTGKLLSMRCELHDEQNCPAGVCADDPKAKPSCWHCGEPGAEDCGKHSETELRHAAHEGDR